MEDIKLASNTHLPLLECSTAFSMNSVMVCDLNLA